MIGHETRDLGTEERNSEGGRDLKCNAVAHFRRETGARAAGCADAAYRRGMRRAASTFVRVMVVAIGVFVHVLFGNRSTPVVRFAQRHQHTGIAAHRQRREQHDQQGDPGCVFHAKNLSPIARAFPARRARCEKCRPKGPWRDSRTRRAPGSFSDNLRNSWSDKIQACHRGRVKTQRPPGPPGSGNRGAGRRGSCASSAGA